MEKVKSIPIFNLMEKNYSRAKAKGKNNFYKYIRGTSSNFIKRNDVRNYVLNKSNHKCLMCGSQINLQIDHIISVYRIIKDSIPIEEVNHVDNLQVLCRKCNASKLP